MGYIFDALTSRSWEEALHKEATKLGQSEGAHGRPAADTPTYDVGETHIRGEVQKQLVKLEQKLAGELQRIVPSITKKDGELSEADLKFQTRKSPADLAQTFDGILADVGVLVRLARTDERQA